MGLVEERGGDCEEGQWWNYNTGLGNTSLPESLAAIGWEWGRGGLEGRDGKALRKGSSKGRKTPQPVDREWSGKDAT